MAFLPVGMAFLPVGMAFLPVGMAFLPVGMAFPPVGVAFLPVGVAFPPVGVAFFRAGLSLPPPNHALELTAGAVGVFAALHALLRPAGSSAWGRQALAHMAPFCDIAVPLLGAFISALLVLRWGWLGAVAGVIVFWGFCYLRLELLYRFDPQREGGVFDAAVIGIVSPALGLLWCLLCLLARFLYRRVRSSRVRRA